MNLGFIGFFETNHKKSNTYLTYNQYFKNNYDNYL